MIISTFRGPRTAQLLQRRRRIPVSMSCSKTTKMRPSIICFGDSITQEAFAGGWGSQLSEMYVRKADVLNRGVSGFNTSWALPVTKKYLNKGAVLLLIFFGANDSALPHGSCSWQHVTIPQFESNLEAMIDLAKSVDIENVVLITPPPVDEAARVIHCKEFYPETAGETSERSNKAAGEYAAACRKVASAAGLPVVDLWTQLQQQSDWKALLSDGLHLTPSGNNAVFTELKHVLTTQLPNVAPDHLPLDTPECGDFLQGQAAPDVLAPYLPAQ